MCGVTKFKANTKVVRVKITRIPKDTLNPVSIILENTSKK
jgi:hypothetical protein